MLFREKDLNAKRLPSVGRQARIVMHYDSTAAHAACPIVPAQYLDGRTAGPPSALAIDGICIKTICEIDHGVLDTLS
jgi:hypothetical protein